MPCCGLQFFAHPVEWSTASIEEAKLILRSARHSNGRAHGEHRVFLLDTMTESTRQGLADFLTSFERLALQHGSHEKLQKAIARRLTRVCGLAGIRKRAPTSFRHSGGSCEGYARYGDCGLHVRSQLTCHSRPELCQRQIIDPWHDADCKSAERPGRQDQVFWGLCLATHDPATWPKTALTQSWHFQLTRCEP